jgi:uncharacterized protein YndB with AHSA1/START domain
VIDVTHQINAVSRAVGSRVLDAGEARTVTVSQTYDTDADDLWDACTNPERIPRWFLPVTGDLRVGGRYQLEGNAGGEVLTCDPPEGFTATWEYDDEISWIEVQVVAEGATRSRLVLEHIAHVDDARWAEFGPGAVGVGWDLAIGLGLGLHLATGAAVDPGEVAAWSASDEGRRFMTLSSDGWFAATVAAGEDAAVARAAADRTTAAYTGADPAAGG